MKKYKKVAINIAFLTIIFSAGLMGKYSCSANTDSVNDWDNNDISTQYQSEKQIKIIDTLENNDYESWKKMIGYKINKIDKKIFQNFVIARQAARRGNYKKAIKLLEQINKKLT